jgi:hypothetical protein
LECDLHSVPLTRHPYYQALSYEWERVHRFT